MSDLIKFACGNCGSGLTSPAGARGQSVTCPHCEQAVLVPLPVLVRPRPMSTEAKVLSGCFLAPFAMCLVGMLLAPLLPRPQAGEITSGITPRQATAADVEDINSSMRAGHRLRPSRTWVFPVSDGKYVAGEIEGPESNGRIGVWFVSSIASLILGMTHVSREFNNFGSMLPKTGKPVAGDTVTAERIEHDVRRLLAEDSE